MKIPIFNSIYNNNKNLNQKKLTLNLLNNLNLNKVDLKKYPLINILKLIPKKILYLKHY